MSQEFLLKDPHMDLLLTDFFLSELQCWGSSSKGSRDIRGGTELSGCRARAGGAAPSRQKCWQKPLFLGCDLSPTSLEAKVGTISESPSTWLIPFALPW